MKISKRQLRHMILETLKDNEKFSGSKSFRMTETRFRALTRSYLIINEGRLDEGFLDFLSNMLGGLFDFLAGAAEAMFSEVKGEISSGAEARRSAISSETGIEEVPSYSDLSPDKNPNDLVIWGLYTADDEPGAMPWALETVLRWMEEPLALESPLPPAESLSDDPEGTWKEGGADYQDLQDTLGDLGNAVGTAMAQAEHAGEFVPEMAAVAAELKKAGGGSDAVAMLQALAVFGDACPAVAAMAEEALGVDLAKSGMDQELVDQLSGMMDGARKGVAMIGELGGEITSMANNVIPKWESAQAEYEKAKQAAELEAKEKEAGGTPEGAETDEGGQPAFGA